ncbi:hypothetical protein D3C80_428820 [compost metagenome]
MLASGPIVAGRRLRLFQVDILVETEPFRRQPESVTSVDVLTQLEQHVILIIVCRIGFGTVSSIAADATAIVQLVTLFIASKEQNGGILDPLCDRRAAIPAVIRAVETSPDLAAPILAFADKIVWFKRPEQKRSAKRTITDPAAICPLNDIDGGKGEEVYTVSSTTGSSGVVPQIAERNAIDQGRDAISFKASDIYRIGCPVEVHARIDRSAEIGDRLNLLLLKLGFGRFRSCGGVLSIT